jgi:hypothetical protein
MSFRLFFFFFFASLFSVDLLRVPVMCVASYSHVCPSVSLSCFHLLCATYRTLFVVCSISMFFLMHNLFATLTTSRTRVVDF